MRFLFSLNHPAHYHLCKIVIKNLKQNGHQVYIIARDKDVLVELLRYEDYYLMSVQKGSGILQKFKKHNSALKETLEYARKIMPDFTAGTGNFYSISKNLGLPAFLLVEDDIVTNFPIFLTGLIFYNKYTGILSPIVCNNSFWNRKSIKYAGYHELAYLHPNHFTPDKQLVEKYFSTEKPYVIIRFAKLNAYHDIGIKGINTEIAQKLIDILKPHADIYITSERELEPQFEQYRIKINPLDMHHVMAFAQLYIGDSQTMAAESGVLGVPFVRFNDFVGRIGYLRELEDVYELGYGVKTNEVDRLFKVVSDLINMKNRKEVFSERRQKMLSEKIDYAQFLTWFIENYPESARIMRENPDYQYKFK